jgi:hypothetical protein
MSQPELTTSSNSLSLTQMLSTMQVTSPARLPLNAEASASSSGVAPTNKVVESTELPSSNLDSQLIRGQQTEAATQFFEQLMQQRQELTYEVCRQVCQIILIFEERLWKLWASADSPMKSLEKAEWVDDMDKKLLKHIQKLRKSKKDILTKQEIVVVIAQMSENYFNRIYRDILDEDVPEYLQHIKTLVNYHPLTILYIIAIQTNQVHLAMERMDLPLTNWNTYREKVSNKLNILMNARFKKIEAAICKTTDSWNMEEMQNVKKPFEFAVEITRSSK